MCFQPPSLVIGKVWVPVMHFCVCHIHCRAHWRTSRRPGFYRSTSALLFIGSTIRKFSISSALQVLQALVVCTDAVLIPSSICGNVVYAVQDQMYPNAPTLWRSTCALCASPGCIGTLIAHRYAYAPPRSTAGLLFPSQYLSGMIWLTPYSMVWDWLVSRAGKMHFC